MTPFSITASTILVLATLVLHQQQVVQAGPPTSRATYLIRAKPVTDIPAAVSQLRRFLPVRQAKPERCLRLAVLLHLVNGNHADAFQVASIGMARSDQIRTKFNSIDVEGLRNLYMNAINSFLQSKQVNDGLVELVECLSDKFRTSDAKARSFLNDAQLKTIIEQYKQISSQPLVLLTDPENHKMPEELSYEDLNPVVKNYLLTLFDGDQSKVDELFKREEAKEKEEGAVEEETEKEVEVEKEAEEVTTTIPTSAIEADQVDNSEKSKEEEEQPAAEPKGTESELDEASRRYMDRMFKALSHVYNFLPLSAKIGDRCQAYSFVISAEEEQLRNERFIEALVVQAERHIKEVGANDQVALEEGPRQDFLFAAAYAPRFLQDTDPEALFDLQECVERLTEGEAPAETATDATTAAPSTAKN